MALAPPSDGDAWLGLTSEPLPIDAALNWAGQPDCGAVVLFSGTVRDHAAGRSGVTELEYEAYEEEVIARLTAIAMEARAHWPVLGRLVLLHRTGRLVVGESSVIVVASAPHRSEAFEIARFSIDSLKETVPIWKRETWADGTDWATGAHDITEVSELRA